jgi:AcrR family transcriptional regulator
MEIARAAAGLFVRQGLRATRAEDIAQAAGVAPRTFYRYFASKEEAIGPLYATGAQRWVEAVRTAPAGVPLPQVLEDAVRHTLTPGLGVSAASWEWVRTLIRLAEANPSLRRVWAEVCQASERSLAEVLAERMGRERAPAGRGGTEPADHEPADDGAADDGAADDRAADYKVADCETADVRAAGHVTVDYGAADVRAAGHVAASHVTAGQLPAAQRTSSPLPQDSDNVADRIRLRFAAAVASAAVRAAMEGWAAGDAPAEGPRGPAELAVGNLAALRDFPWGTWTAGA